MLNTIRQSNYYVTAPSSESVLSIVHGELNRFDAVFTDDFGHSKPSNTVSHRITATWLKWRRIVSQCGDLDNVSNWGLNCV